MFSSRLSNLRKLILRKLVRAYQKWKRRKWIHFFCHCEDGEHTWCTDPDLLFIALQDARDTMSYSNWMLDKLWTIEEILKQFYKEKGIPMGRLNRFFRKVAGDGHAHWCPGCKEMHVIPKTWQFNGDIDKATFSPSVKITFPKGYYKNGEFSTEEKICHYILTDGVLHFCSDCSHELAGKDVSLPELPEKYVPENEDQECQEG